MNIKRAGVSFVSTDLAFASKILNGKQPLLFTLTLGVFLVAFATRSSFVSVKLIGICFSTDPAFVGPGFRIGLQPMFRKPVFHVGG